MCMISFEITDIYTNYFDFIVIKSNKIKIYQLLRLSLFLIRYTIKMCTDINFIHLTVFFKYNFSGRPLSILAYLY